MFLFTSWRLLPLPTRAILAKQFGFAKVGPTHVVDNRIQDDGYKIEDVERALNVDAIQTYLQSQETDMNILWEAMVAKAEGRVQFYDDKPLTAEQAKEIIALVNDKGVVAPSKALLDVVVAQEPLAKRAFCDSCTSRGTRHLKVCPKNK